MAAVKRKPPKDSARGGKKGIRGRMPVKKSINLILIDENRISPVKAALGIIVIVALAAVFSKYLVLDRLTAVSTASSRVNRLRTDLDNALTAAEAFGDVEDAYAHYTYADMTAAELGLVDRIMVLDLMDSILPAQHATLNTENFASQFSALAGTLHTGSGEPKPVNELTLLVRESLIQLFQLRSSLAQSASWSVSDNILTVDVTGESLEALNQVARRLEEHPIVDTCIITTANKGARKDDEESQVSARYIIYLQQPPEEEPEP